MGTPKAIDPMTTPDDAVLGLALSLIVPAWIWGGF